jgi:hypothetical protein
MTIAGYLKLRRRVREIVYKEDLPLFFEQHPDFILFKLVPELRYG